MKSLKRLRRLAGQGHCEAGWNLRHPGEMGVVRIRNCKLSGTEKLFPNDLKENVGYEVFRRKKALGLRVKDDRRSPLSIPFSFRGRT